MEFHKEILHTQSHMYNINGKDFLKIIRTTFKHF